MIIMSAKLEDSRLKLARLQSAFTKDTLDLESIESILKTDGDINYRLSSCKQYGGYTALHYIKFLQDQKLEVLQLLLKYKADFTIKNDEEQTIVHEALDNYTDELSAQWGLKSELSDEIVSAVLAAHFDNLVTENPKNKYGLTHFHAACMIGHVAAVKMFLDNGVPVDMTVNDNSPVFPGCTPLFIAVKSCALEVVKVLLEYHADPNVKDRDGTSPLLWLIECNLELVDFSIMKTEKGVSSEAPSKLEVNQQILDLLLNSNQINSSTFTDEIGLTSLHIACTRGNVAAVKELLTHVTEIDQAVNANSHIWPGFTALHFAAYFCLDTVKLLLSRGASLIITNTNGFTPFDICLERYRIRDILYIMSTQPEWSGITLCDGKTKLFDLVSAMQEIQKFKSLLDNHSGESLSISKNSSLWPGYTPLHLAVLLSERTKSRSSYTLSGKFSSGWKPAEMIFQPSLIWVEECLNRQFDVTCADRFGCTPLHLAFRYQKTLMVKKLLQFHHKAVNPVDEYNVSHLHIACAFGDEVLVKKLLLIPGINLDLPVFSDFKFYQEETAGRTSMTYLPVDSTPLHSAVAARSFKVVKLLVNNGANVNAMDINGVTPIHRLVIGGSLDIEDEISKTLLSSANLIEVMADYTIISYLHIASFFNNVDAVKRLLDLGASIDARLPSESVLNDMFMYYTDRKCTSIKYEDTALHLAIRRKSRQVVTLLLHRGADMLAKKSDGEYPLYSVIISEDSGACLDIFAQFLFDNAAEAERVENYCGLTVLHLASCIPDPLLVGKLIRHGVNVNAQLNKNSIYPVGYTALHMLINCCCSMGTLDEDFERKFFEVARMLLDANCDVTLCNAEGKTPIHMLYNNYSPKEKLHVDLLKLMVNGIKVFHTNPMDEHRVSLFHIACFENNLTIIKKFLACGMEINAAIDLFHCREAGSSALHLIFQKTHWSRESPKIEIIDALLEYGANVDTQNIDGDTILHRIIGFEPFRVDIFRSFIRSGADLNKQNRLKETPFTKLFLLNQVNKLKVVKLLVEYEYSINQFSPDEQGWLAQFLCGKNSRQDRTEIFETLFKSCRINESNAAGLNAIHNIVSTTAWDISPNVSVEEYSKLITTLCNKGCNIDSQAKYGITALHVAARFMNFKAVSALLLNGADINIVDISNITAFEYSWNFMESCKCANKAWHRKSTEILYLHVRKLLHLNMDVNENIINLMPEANTRFPMDDIDIMNKFCMQVSDMRAFVLGEGSASFDLKDVLSETGVITVYPFNQSVRTVLDTYLKNIDVYLKGYEEFIGLVNLQIRKAKKREELVSSLLFMRSQLMGSSTQSCRVSNLPDICYCNILRYLRNSDLINMILATKLLKLPNDGNDDMPVDMKKSLIEITGSYNPNAPKRIKLDLLN